MPDHYIKFVRNNDTKTMSTPYYWNFYDSLNSIIHECWADFIQAKQAKKSFIVNPSIPILWFGDLSGYEESPVKIVTIGINPSNNEFLNKDTGKLELGYRFPELSTLRLRENLSDLDAKGYYMSLNNYFRNNPFKSWFQWNESALNGLDASYYTDKGKMNIAVHLDYEAPVATDPVWNPLKELCKKQGIPAVSNLGSRFNKYIYKMLDVLSPDIVIIGINEASFRRAFPQCPGYGNEIIHTKAGGYVRIYNSQGCSIVWNRVRNTPFFGIGSHAQITSLFQNNIVMFDVFKTK